MKKIIWQGTSLKDVISFPDYVKKRVGFELFAVQQGKEPSDWKMMPSVGLGVKEIRIHFNNEYRILYVAKFTEGIYVLHAFIKKTQKTEKAAIELAKKRMLEVIAARSK